tara:strand:- start:19 stop:276 length:258 start_codon:yes stop_codon:yes gene_type:complete
MSRIGNFTETVGEPNKNKKKHNSFLYLVMIRFLKWHIAKEYIYNWGWVGLYGSFSHEILGFAIGLENIDIHILFIHFKVCWVNEA